MDTKKTYSSKAEKYARYRWDYEPRAIEAIFQTAQLTASSVVADIGAGTGILTKHFAGKVGRVYAVEPNDEMRREAAKRLPASSGCRLLAGCAEQVPLPDHCLDLITVAQAIHWCDPEPTRREFARLIKPSGWLALLRNYPTDQALGQAIGEVLVAENGVEDQKASPAGYHKADGFYFAGEQFQKSVFPFAYQQDWETFFGSLVTASYMPDPDHPAYPRLEKAARDVFQRFSQEGLLHCHAETELLIGPGYR